jgi:hypothetical protein
VNVTIQVTIGPPRWRSFRKPRSSACNNCSGGTEGRPKWI